MLPRLLKFMAKFLLENF